MKKSMIMLLGLSLLTSSLFGQVSIQETNTSDSLGVIGDHLDLSAVLNTFKNSESIEAFEKAINDPDGKMNNLDLNEDDEVDYIQVIDEMDGDAHAFILRIEMEKEEAQDVAVIELEKTEEGAAQIQIIGDEEIYGANYILEPQESEATTKRIFAPQLIVINVWTWSSVRFVYGPSYRPWRSPWSWRNYPSWWRPWRPVGWRSYNGQMRQHHVHFHRVTTRRCVRSHRVYHTNRRTTVLVRNHRHHPSQRAGNNSRNGSRTATKNPSKSNQKNTVKTRNTKQNKRGQQGAQKRSNGNGTSRKGGSSSTKRGNSSSSKGKR